MAVPNYFQDVWDEVAIMSRWHTARKNHEVNVGGLSAKDPRTGKTGFQRLRQIAEAGPVMANYAVPLARSGADPDENPNLVHFVQQQAELMRREQGGMPAFGGIARPMAGQSSNVPRYRLRNAMDAANAIGLVKNGVLHEPETTDPSSPERWIFEDLRGAAMGAMRNLPYVDRNGQDRSLKWSNEPALPGATNAHQLFRQMESAEEPFNELKADEGFNRFEVIAHQLPNGQELLNQAKELNLLDEDGFLINADKLSGLEDDQVIPGKPSANFLQDQARRAWFEQLETLADQSGTKLAAVGARGMQVREPQLPQSGTGTGSWRVIGVDDDFTGSPRPMEPPPEEGGGGPLGAIGRTVENVQTAGYTGMKDTAVGRSGFGSSAIDTAQEGMQFAGVAMNAPYQELQGQVRNLYQAVNGGSPDWTESQSDLGVAIGTGDFDFGQGMMVDPESQIAEERQRREAERGQIDGHNVTLGRWVASSIADADTPVFDTVSGLVDFGTAIYGDPSTYALKGAGKFNQARNTIRAPQQAAGAFDAGITKWVHGPTAEQALNGRWGRGVTEKLAATDNAAEIARRTNYKWSPELYTRIADESDPTQIRAILKPELGTRIRSLKDVYQGVGGIQPRIAENAPVLGRSGPAKSTTWARWMAEMPENQVDVTDPIGTVRQVQNWGQTMRMPQADIDTINNGILRAADSMERREWLGTFMRKRDGVLERHGITNPDVRNGMVEKMFSDIDEMKLWYGDEIADSAPAWDNAVIDDEVVAAGTVLRDTANPDIPLQKSPHLAMVSTDGIVHLGDAQELRRATSNPALRWLTTKHSLWNTEAMTGEMRTGLLAVEALQETLWKPLALARLAWTVRVIGEEQLRMAATPGIDSFFNHPLSFIGSRLHFKNDLDVFGNPISLSDAHKSAMMTRRGGLLDDIPGRVRSNTHNTIYRKASGDPGWRYTRAQELARLNRDPITNRLTNAETLDEVVEWGIRGEGQGAVKQLSDITGVTYTDERLFRSYLTRAQHRIADLTGGDNDLLNAVATGKLGKHNLYTKNGAYVNKKFTDALAKYDESGPDSLVGEMSDPKSYEGKWARLERGKDHAVDALFRQLMSERTNNLSRSPYFRQEYWRRMTELAPYTDNPDELRSAFSSAASTSVREAGEEGFISKRLHRKFEYDLKNVVNDPDVNLSLAEMDMIAKDYALQATKRRLFDLSGKKNWEDTMKLISPFISAWKEVFTSWGRLVKENPSVIRRGFQGYDAATRSGVFYKDETTGEMIFTYPGSEWLTKTMIGVPIPMTGNAQGLSFMSQVIPGIGPAMQVPISLFMADKPQFQELYQKLVPFGSPAEAGPDEALNPLNYAPPWIRRLAQAGSSAAGDVVGKDWNWGGESEERIYANSVMQVARYLSSTGEYDLESEADWQRMMDDAKGKADLWYMIRGVGSAALPTAPAPRWLMETGSGDLIPTAVLTSEYQAMQRGEYPGIDFTNADEEFLARYGDEVVLAMTPFSRTVTWGLDPSLEFHEWVTENPQIKRDYGSIYGLFGPTGKFDIGVFSDQFYGDERDALSPEEWQRFSQHMLASRLYEKERALFGDDADTDDNSAYLSEYKDWLRETYPGYLNFRGQAQGPEFGPAMAELRRATEDPALADNPVMVAAKDYLAERDWAEEDLAAQDLHSFRSDSAAEYRDYLRNYAQTLIDETPEFERMFDMVLAKEFEED